MSIQIYCDKCDKYLGGINFTEEAMADTEGINKTIENWKKASCERICGDEDSSITEQGL